LRAYRILSLVLLIGLALGPAGDGRAEPPPKKDWEVEILPYAWLPSLDGSIEKPSGATEHFSIGLSDVLDSLDLAAFGRVNVRWRRWVGYMDGLYTKLGDDESVQRRNIRIDADLELQMALAQLLGGYRIYARPGGLFGSATPADERLFGIDLLVGVNYTWVKTELELDRAAVGPIPERERNLEVSDDWFAPAVGLRLHNDFSSRIRLETLASVGGFGVGDAPDLSWQLTTLLSYRFTDHWLVSIGHRLIAVEGDNLDLRMHGALLGFGYRF